MKRYRKQPVDQLTRLLIFLFLLLLSICAYLIHTSMRHIQRDRDFMMAVKRLDPLAAKRLLEAGADVDTRDAPLPDWHDPGDWLHLLLQQRRNVQRYPTALQVIMAYNADFNTYFSPLSPNHTFPSYLIQPYQQTSRLDQEIAALLIAHGANVNVRDEQGNTPLLLALWNDEHGQLSKLLLARGADVNATYKNGESALYYAIGSDSPDCIHSLLDTGANVNARDKTNGCTVLDQLLFRLSKDPDCNQPVWHALCNRLLDRGADLRAQDEEGNTPLFYAANVDDSYYLRLLIARGCEVNVSNSDGDMPLMEALGSLDNFNVLLEHGANLHYRDKRGLNILQHGPTVAQQGSNSYSGPSPDILAKLRRLGVNY